MAGNWDFIADSDNQLSLSEQLHEDSDKFLTRKDEMYASVDKMGEYWEGVDASAFNTYAHGFDQALIDLGNSIEMYSVHFKTLSGETTTLTNECKAIIEDLTGASITGGSSGGTAGGDPGAAGGDPSGSGNGDGSQQENGDQEGAQNGDPVDPTTPQGGDESAQQAPDTQWHSYEDADAAGYGEIMTEDQFNAERAKLDELPPGMFDKIKESLPKTYEEYLAVQQAKYDPVGAGAWQSYSDAQSAGFGANVMTESQYRKFVEEAPDFLRDSLPSYQDYLIKQWRDNGAPVTNSGSGVSGATSGGITGGTSGNTGNIGNTGNASDTSNQTASQGGYTEPSGTLYNSGDAVTVNGENYHVYGYVRGADGKSLGIYEGSDGYLYYFDGSGKRQDVMVNQTMYGTYGGMPAEYSSHAKADALGMATSIGGTVSASTYTINGVQYKKDDVVASGYSGDNVSANPAGSHASYTQVNSGTVQEQNYSSLGSSNHGESVALAGHQGNATLSVPANTNELRTAANNHQPIKLQEGKTLFVDDTGWNNRTYGKNGDTYFVYNNGYYYEADARGNILDYSDPISVDLLTGKGAGNDTGIE